MELLGKVRRMFHRDKLSRSEIARRTGLSRNTVKKWLQAVEGATPKYRRQEAPGKLSAFHEVLLRALEADARRPKRDRRTGKALHAEIKAQGYTGGYLHLLPSKSDSILGHPWQTKFRGKLINPFRGVPLVIADDMTGATEVALSLADVGLGDLAWLWKDGASPPDDIGCSVNLDTRDMQADEACSRLADFLERHPNLRRRIIFKKIDSTARRHLAAEIDVCLRFPEFDAVVVALAAPDDLRHTANGIHHVGPLPVDRTPFAPDLAVPTSHLPTLLTAGTTRTCFHVPITAVRQGADAIAAAMASALNAEKPIISMDCETRDDLRSIAHAVMQSPRRILPMGSAAMFGELIGVATKPAVDPSCPLPIFIICGSLHPVTRRQIDRLCTRSGAVSAQIDATSDDALVDSLVTAISQGKDAVLCTPGSRDSVDGSDIHMTTRVASLVRAVLARERPCGLIAMGGNISSAVINHIGADGLRVLDRLSPVVRVLEISGGPFSGLPIITKGGGVGSDDILIDAVAVLRKIAVQRSGAASILESTRQG